MGFHKPLYDKAGSFQGGGTLYFEGGGGLGWPATTKWVPFNDFRVQSVVCRNLETLKSFWIWSKPRKKNSDTFHEILVV